MLYAVHYKRLLAEYGLTRDHFLPWIHPSDGGTWTRNTEVEVEDDVPKGAYTFDVKYEEKDDLKKNFGIMWNKKRKLWFVTEEKLAGKNQTLDDLSTAVKKYKVET